MDEAARLAQNQAPSTWQRRQQERLDLLRREYDTLMRLLDLDVESAESEFRLAERQFESAKRIVAEEPGVIAASELQKREAQFNQAMLRLRRARELRDLYRAALPKQQAPPEPDGRTRPAPPGLTPPEPENEADQPPVFRKEPQTKQADDQPDTIPSPMRK